MIVTCPGCAAKYRVKDEAVPAGGAKMKCPKCGKFFAAHRPSDDAASAVPQPVDFELDAAFESAAQPAAAHEWDAMMKAEGLVLGPTPGAGPTAARPAASPSAPPAAQVQATEPRSAFHAAPTEESAPSGGTPLAPGFSQEVQLHDPLGAYRASAPATHATRDEISDPFANINIMAPASQPVAGSGENVLLGAQRGKAAPAPGPAPPFSAQRPATPVVPPASSTSLPSAPKSSTGITIREPTGQVHEFKYLPPARQWVAQHHSPETLEVSIAGAPFAKVTTTHAFADLKLERGAAERVEAPAPSGSPSVIQHETYPPPPAPAARPLALDEPPTLLARLGLIGAAALAGLAVLFAVWQFELLPLEPHLTRALSSITGGRSPLVVPEVDAENEAEQALEEAQQARDKGSLAMAVIHYRRALALRRNSPEILRGLAYCYQALGDSGAVAELRRVVPDAFDEDEPQPAPAPAPEEVKKPK